MRLSLNNDWGFTRTYSDALLSPDCSVALESVRLPHTVCVTPLHYFDESVYQMVSGYRRVLFAPEEWREKKVLLTLEGAAHSTWVYCNGALAAEHHCGYTAFTADLTDYLRFGEENVLVLRVDSREDQNIPPFGFVIDYMTYGGVYREAWLDIKEKTFLQDVYLRPRVPEDLELPGQKTGSRDLTRALQRFQFRGELHPSLRIAGEREGLSVRIRVRESGGEKEFTSETVPLEKLRELALTGVRLWDVLSPVIYVVTVELLDGEKLLDEKELRIGFRRSEFRKDGYYLNGRKLKIRGLNRHQAYPYVGYAMPAAVQRQDAEILRRELGVNAVRTSHYPQSRHFLDACDELGLLVFTEIPGWQHIGDDAWKDQALENVRDMVVQNRSHPSVILWGVRINESQDDDPFYTETNALAHCLDSERQTSGVRFLKQSSFLEDVYAYNDFSHSGANPGCIDPTEATPDPDRPYFISEYNGHMYPTKAFDSEGHRQEHALRHANVLDAVAANHMIAGSFGWCMNDYNTHKDFGSGDRVCYHGVMDQFRNPKMAAAVYASQQDQVPVLEISSTMDIGEHPASMRGNIWIFTNADSVRMYKNDTLIKEYLPSESPYTHLAHGPIVIDSYVDPAIEEKEHFTPRQAKLVKDILNSAARFGMDHLPLKVKAQAAEAMGRYRMSFADAYDLYQKYIGDWGGKATVFRFEAVKNGEVVAERRCTIAREVRLCAIADHTELTEGDTYDVASVRIQARDENGNLLPFFNETIHARVEGPAELIGPEYFSLSGGMGGTYVKTTGGEGTVRLILEDLHQVPGTQAAVLCFTVTKQNGSQA